MHLKTSRLILRDPKKTDVDDYLEFVNSEFVQRYNAMTPVTRQKAEADFSNAPDHANTVVMELTATGKIIGVIHIEPDSLRYGVSSKELSYFLREEMSQKGYMNEALQAIITYLFEEEKLTCVAARCFAPNIASQRLLESLGFQREGTLRKCVKGYRDTIFDDCLYSLMQER